MMSKQFCAALASPFDIGKRRYVIHFDWIGIILICAGIATALTKSRLSIFDSLAMILLGLLLVCIHWNAANYLKKEEMAADLKKSDFNVAVKEYRSAIIDSYNSNDRDDIDLSHRKNKVIEAFREIPLSKSNESLVTLFMILGSPAKSSSEDASRRLNNWIQLLTYELIREIKGKGEIKKLKD